MRRRVRAAIDGGEGSLPEGQDGVDAGAPLIQQPRILYVDADQFRSALTRATLEDAGFEVDWFATARNAAEAAEDGATFDVWLLQADCSNGPEAERLLSTAVDDARVIVVGGEPRLATGTRRPWQLPRTCPPHLLAQAVRTAARAGRRAA